MAYSDYGGYAYRNDERVIERSDYTLTPDGGFGVPGMYPGFAAVIAGMNKEDVKAIREMPNGHAVIGDGPIFVCLKKQSYLSVYRGFDRVELIDILKTNDPSAIDEWEHEGKKKYVNVDHFKSTEEKCEFEIEGHKIEVYWRIEDNHYQYVRMTQPDGNVWTAWSGYGVGAGLETCDYGYSTEDRETVMRELFKSPGASHAT